ncbi:hypothetical protein RJ639_032256 [Escallonia herrerae]|uniref:NB-ARC domain-containing protein n=1 Tax=Escallonia herrerae TaxID=1293975 RepID=A0AA88WZZ5_9ASTE|nr:hypothetical protein RJ639_032256 [Escallonia herrerae]
MNRLSMALTKMLKALEAKLLNIETEYDLTKIIGMPGIGKTILAKKLFNTIDSRFQCSALFMFLKSLTRKRSYIEEDGARMVEDVAENCIDNLVSRNLIQVTRKKFDGRTKSFRIHDLLHNFCIEVAEIDFFATLKNFSPNSSTRARRFTTLGRSINAYVEVDHQSPKLRAFGCFRQSYVGSDIPKQFENRFKDFKLLRVLNRECHVGRWSIPDETGEFMHWTYLYLKGIHDLQLPATISNLQNLLTSEVQHQKNHVGWSTDFLTSIWEMKRLRYTGSAVPI